MMTNDEDRSVLAVLKELYDESPDDFKEYILSKMYKNSVREEIISYLEDAEFYGIATDPRRLM